jgi:hypothetical protein
LVINARNKSSKLHYNTQPNTIKISDKDYDEQDQSLTENPKNNQNGHSFSPDPSSFSKKKFITKSSHYKTGEIDAFVPEYKPAIEHEESQHNNHDNDIDRSIEGEQDEEESFNDEIIYNDNLTPLANMEKPQYMNIYYDTVFSNLLSCFLISKFEEEAFKLRRIQKKHFQRYINQCLVQDPQTFRKVDSLLSFKQEYLLRDAQQTLYKMVKNDSNIGSLTSSKYGTNYWPTHKNELIKLDKQMNCINFCQIISENLLNLYMEKIRKINEGEQFVPQREYLFKSGFTEDLLKYD